MVRPRKAAEIRRTVSLRLPPDAVGRLDALAGEWGLSRGEVVERLLGSGSSAIERPDPVMPEGRKPWNPPRVPRREVTPRFKT